MFVRFLDKINGILSKTNTMLRGKRTLRSRVSNFKAIFSLPCEKGRMQRCYSSSLTHTYFFAETSPPRPYHELQIILHDNARGIPLLLGNFKSQILESRIQPCAVATDFSVICKRKLFMTLKCFVFIYFFPAKYNFTQKFYRQTTLDVSSRIQLNIAIQLSCTIHAYKSLGELYLKLGNRVIKVHRW